MALIANSLDSLIKEYLIFRGFTGTLKNFELDLKNDKNKSFKVENILDHFTLCIQNYDILSLRKYWKYFDRCFFSQLNHDTYKVIKKLESNVLKLYIVHGVQTGKPEKVNEFFEKYASELHHEDSWKEWFSIAFIKNPEQARFFNIYFTKIWQDSVLLSLGNCLETVFNNITLPTLLNFEKEKGKFEKLEETNIKLLGQLASYEKEIIQYHSSARKEKLDANTQTADLDISPEKLRKSRSTEGAGKTKFGWKIFASNKDGSKTSKKDDKDLLRASLDEGALQKLKHFSKSNQENKNKKDNTSLEGDREKPSSDVIASGSEFFLPFEGDDKHKEPRDKEPSQQLFAGHKNNQESPFIVLSQDEFKEHTSPIVACRFSENNNIVASLDQSGVLKIWQCYPSISTESTITLKGDFVTFDWVPKLDGKLVLGKSNSQLSMYDINLKKVLWETHVHPKYKRINCISSSPTAAMAALSVVSDHRKNSTNQSAKFIKMKQYPFSTPKTPREGSLILWDLQTGQKKSDLSLDPYPVCIHALTFNHNGTLLVSAGADGMIRLYDIRNNDCLIGWHGHSINVLDVKFNPGETCIFSIDANGKLSVWDINKVSSKIAEFPLHYGSTGIYNYNNQNASEGDYDRMASTKLLAYDSDGNHMLSCAPSGLMIYKVKPINELEEVMHIVSRCSEVLTLDWSSSPNCSTAMCGTQKGTVQISTLLKR